MNWSSRNPYTWTTRKHYPTFIIKHVPTIQIIHRERKKIGKGRKFKIEIVNCSHQSDQTFACICILFIFFIGRNRRQVLSTLQQFTHALPIELDILLVWLIKIRRSHTKDYKLKKEEFNLLTSMMVWFDLVQFEREYNWVWNWKGFELKLKWKWKRCLCRVFLFSYQWRRERHTWIPQWLSTCLLLVLSHQY